MRRRRRHFNNNDDDNYTSDYDNDVIPLAEFMFYNKEVKAINNETLEEIEKKLLKNKHQNIFWTNNIFAKHKIGFKFRCYDNKFKKGIYIKIIETEGAFTVADFLKCKEIIDGKIMFHFNTEPSQENMIEKISFSNLNLTGEKISGTNNGEARITIGKMFIVNDFSQLMDLMIEKKLLNNYNPLEENDWGIYNRDIEYMFNKTLKKPEYNKLQDEYTSINIFHIIDVIEKRVNNKNYRIALISKINHYDTYYSFKVFDEESEDYNYIDKDRIFITSYAELFYYIDLQLNEYAEDGNMIIRIKLLNEISKNIREVLGDNDILITPMIYRFYKERVLTFNFDDSPLSETEIKIAEQYKKLLEEGRTLKIDNLLIDKNKIALADENFSLEFDEKFIDVKSQIGNIKRAMKEGDARFNFNKIYENLLGMSALNVIQSYNVQEKGYKEFKESEFTVNKIPIKVTKESNRIKINGIFCRIIDLFYILNKAICFQNEDDFNKFIKEISYIGAEWKKMINNGIPLYLKNPFFNIFDKIKYSNNIEKTYMRFSLLWDAEKRRNVFLIINNQRYLIKYKGKFKKYFGNINKLVTIDKLKKELSECIEGLDDKAIFGIVVNAVEEAKIIKERGEELVANTIKDTKAKECEIDIRGTKFNGYKIKGIVTNSIYFIKREDLEVYKFTDGVWNRRCVVDDSSKQRIFEDKLANRLVNIYNEPTYISTLH